MTTVAAQLYYDSIALIESGEVEIWARTRHSGQSLKAESVMNRQTADL